MIRFVRTVHQTLAVERDYFLLDPGPLLFVIADGEPVLPLVAIQGKVDFDDDVR